jgi:hypothetical protein
MVAHECIIDIRPLKEESGITEEDIAKRLMDYGFHSPMMSFPVAGSKASIAIHEQNKLRSPYTLSIRLTGGKYLLCFKDSTGYSAVVRE